MQNYMTIIINAIKSWVNGKINNAINEIPQADWNQSDETAKDYVKNRTHYDDSKTFFNLEDYNGDYSSLESVETEGPTYYKVSEADGIDLSGFFDIEFFVNSVEKDKVNNLKPNELFTQNNPALTYGIQREEYPYGTSVHLGIHRDMHHANASLIIALEDNSTFNIVGTEITLPKGIWVANIEQIPVFTSLTINAVKQLDQKYIPNADWNQHNIYGEGYIKNRTHYEDTKPIIDVTFEVTEGTGNPILDEGTDVRYFFIVGNTYKIVINNQEYESVFKSMYDNSTGEYYYGLNLPDVMPMGNYNLNTNYSFALISEYSESEEYKPENGQTFHSNAMQFHLWKEGGFTFPATVQIYHNEIELKQLDSKYIKDMYYETEPVEVLLVDNLSSTVTEDEYPGCTFVVGDNYKVIWNDVEYDCICYLNDGYRALGAPEDGCPFYIDDDGGNALYIDSSDEEWTVSIIHMQTELHHVPTKYIKDMYHEEFKEIFNIKDAEFTDGHYLYQPGFVITEGNIYIVNWDGVEYVCEAFMAGIPAIGNMAAEGGPNTGEPFLIGYFGPENGNPFIADEPGSSTHTISIKEKIIHHLDPKYIKDMYYDNGKTVTELVPLQTVSGFTLMEEPIYGVENPFELKLTEDATYVVNWDGMEYELTCEVSQGIPYIGNFNLLNMQPDGDIPFGIVANELEGFVIVATASTKESHEISITEVIYDMKQLDIKYLPILEEDYELIFEGNSEGGSIENDKYKMFYGKYRITIDGKSKTVYFDNNESGISTYLVPSGNKVVTEDWVIISRDGGIYFDFKIEGIHSIKIEKAIKAIKKEHLLNPNWNENNSNSTAYIENRTHYVGPGVIPTIIPKTTVIFGAATRPGYDTGTATGIAEYFYPNLGDIIAVEWNDEIYELEVNEYTKMDGSFGRGIGEAGMFGGIPKGYPFLIGFLTEAEAATAGYTYVVWVNDGSTTATFSVGEFSENVVYQLDEKFIPDSVKVKDWNENDESSVSYIKNRPFYTLSVETEIANCTLSSMTETDGVYYATGDLLENHQTFTDGQEMTIIYDSDEYSCSVKEIEVNGYTFMCVGNLSIFDHSQEDTGEPFLIEFTAVTFMLYTIDSDDSHTVQIVKIETEINQLDEKYIPNTVATKEWVEENTISINSTAQVGQLISVKAVDENGKPTEWETVDPTTIFEEFGFTVDKNGVLVGGAVGDDVTDEHINSMIDAKLDNLPETGVENIVWTDDLLAEGIITANSTVNIENYNTGITVGKLREYKSFAYILKGVSNTGLGNLYLHVGDGTYQKTRNLSRSNDGGIVIVYEWCDTARTVLKPVSGYSGNPSMVDLGAFAHTSGAAQVLYSMGQYNIRMYIDMRTFSNGSPISDDLPLYFQCSNTPTIDYNYEIRGLTK